jgi:hypothetical protein
MTLYEYNCIRAGWQMANGVKDDDTDEAFIPEEEFERLLAAHTERSEQATRVVSAEEFVRTNKDKVRPS